jgi:hypothetical protein
MQYIYIIASQHDLGMLPKLNSTNFNERASRTLRLISALIVDYAASYLNHVEST